MVRISAPTSKAKMIPSFVCVIAVLSLSWWTSLSAHDCSFRRCHSAFTFNNETASAIDMEHGQRLRPVRNFTLNSNYHTLSNYTVAVIGDSLDLHMCFELMKRMGKLTYDADGIPEQSPATVIPEQSML